MKQYQKNGQIKLKSHIVIKRDGMQIINPSEELILADGRACLKDYVTEQYFYGTNGYDFEYGESYDIIRN